MLKNIAQYFECWLTTPKQKLEDQEWLDELVTENKIDEASAYAVLLTDLARADGNFSDVERVVISSTLLKIFPERVQDIETLVETAENILNSFRGTSGFIERIKEEYSVEERERLYAMIEQVIDADQLEEPIEIYLKHKFQAALI